MNDRTNRLAKLISQTEEKPAVEASAPAPVPAAPPKAASQPAVEAPRKTRRKAAPPPRTLDLKPGRDYTMSTIVWRQDVDDLEMKLLLLSRKLGVKRRIAVSTLTAGLLSLANRDDDLLRRAAEAILGEESE